MPELETNGRFYFVPQGTPHLPVPNLFGSKNWIRNSLVFEGDFGEVDQGPRAFDRGEAPSPPPMAVVCGDPAFLCELAPFPHAQPPISADGVARCCRDCDPDAAVNPNILAGREPIALAIGAIIAGYAYVPEDFSLLEDFYALCGWTLLDTFVSQNEDVFGECWSFIHYLDTCTVIGIAGTTSNEEFALQVVYSINGPQPVGGFESHAMYNASALELYSQLANRSLPAHQPIIIAGHSMGGAVGTVLAARLLLGNPTLAVQLFTYGAPKGVTSRGATLASLASVARVYRDYDPFPLLPPVLGWEWIAGLPVLAWSPWAHPGPAFRLTEGGELGAGYAAILAEDVALLCLAVLNGLSLPFFVAHTLPAYLAPLADLSLVHSGSCIWTDARVDALIAAKDWIID